MQETASLSLHRLSDTRWSARIDAVKPLVKRPREILQSLSTVKMELDLPADVCSEVDSLANWIQSFEFVVLASFWFKTLQAIDDVSRALQSSSLTLDDEAELTKSLISTLQRIRDSWPIILEECRLVAAGLGVQEDFKETRRRKPHLFLSDSQAAHHQHETPELHFKINIFYVALDTLIQQISARHDTTMKLNAMLSFIWNPTAEADLRITKAQELSKSYPKDLKVDEFVEEVRCMGTLCQPGKALFSMGQVTSLQFLNVLYRKGLQNLFPQTCIALRIFVSIPVTVAEAERTFSKLSLVKNCLRSTMSEGRLSSLVVLASEHDLPCKLSYDSIIESFSQKKARKVHLF